MDPKFVIRPLQHADRDSVASLIHHSTNAWYERNLNRQVFAGEPLNCQVFVDVYEDLDPGCCLLAVDRDGGTIRGSCFFHPRETHWSIGIMNASPEPEARGAAKALLEEIVRRADAARRPLRLVSSASNLDSFSLYSRAGFVPLRIYQDMTLSVPADGLDPKSRPAASSRVRPATLDDLPAMVALENQVAGLRREKDYRLFIENQLGIWSTMVLDTPSAGSGLAGFLTSVAHPASRMLGPGIASDTATARALIWSLLDHHHRGHSPVWLVPSDSPKLVHTCYGWGARNSEIHLVQARGPTPVHRGLIFPTFMPETG